MGESADASSPPTLIQGPRPLIAHRASGWKSTRCVKRIVSRVVLVAPPEGTWPFPGLARSFCSNLAATNRAHPVDWKNHVETIYSIYSGAVLVVGV